MNLDGGGAGGGRFRRGGGFRRQQPLLLFPLGPLAPLPASSVLLFSPLHLAGLEFEGSFGLIGGFPNRIFPSSVSASVSRDG